MWYKMELADLRQCLDTWFWRLKEIAKWPVFTPAGWDLYNSFPRHSPACWVGSQPNITAVHLYSLNILKLSLAGMSFWVYFVILYYIIIMGVLRPSLFIGFFCRAGPTKSILKIYVAMATKNFWINIILMPGPNLQFSHRFVLWLVLSCQPQYKPLGKS